MFSAVSRDVPFLGVRSGEKGRTGLLYLSALRDVRSKTAGDVYQTTIVRAHHREENQGVMKDDAKTRIVGNVKPERTLSAGLVH